MRVSWKVSRSFAHRSSFGSMIITALRSAIDVTDASHDAVVCPDALMTTRNFRDSLIYPH
jgi:hypothetical protein